MEELVEVKCLNCGKTYMAEYDYQTGKLYGGCPHCDSDEFERVTKL